MKKVLSIILALCMLLSASFALADEDALTLKGTVSDIVLTMSYGDETQTVDLTGLSLGAKGLVGANGIEGVLNIAAGGSDVLNLIGQLSNEGMLYIGADQFSKVLSLDLKALLEKVMTHLKDLVEDYLSDLTEQDVEDALEAIKEIAEALAANAEAYREALPGVDLNLNLNTSNYSYFGTDVNCLAITGDITFEEPICFGEEDDCTKIGGAAMKLYVDDSDEPSYLAAELTVLGAEQETVFDGTIVIAEESEDTYRLALTMNDVELVSGTIIDNDNTTSVKLSGELFNLVLEDNTNYTDNGFTRTSVASFDVAGESIFTMNGNAELAGTALTIAADMNLAEAMTMKFAYEGSFEEDDHSLSNAGTYTANVTAGDYKIDMTFKTTLEGSDKDETVDLSTKDLLDLTDLESLTKLGEDETLMSEVSLFLMTAMAQLQSVPAIAELLQNAFVE